MNFPSVSIGICAYNEESMIGSVVRGILKQSESGWNLKELIVISDGSTDLTVDKVNEIVDERITIIDNKDRKGKTKRLQDLFQFFSGDILIMFDADIEIFDIGVVTALIRKFSDNRNVALVGGNSRPLLPANFFERAVYSTFQVFDASRDLIKDGNNIFGCTGSILAIEKDLAKSISFPQIVNEDAFLYFSCLKLGKQFRYAKDAVIFYKLPSTLGDFLKQTFRSDPEAVEHELERFFGGIVRDEFSRPIVVYGQAVLSVLLKNPVGVIWIVILKILSRPFMGIVMSNYKLDWFTAKSTKKV